MARSCHRSVDPASSDAVPLLCDLARRRWSLTRLSIRPSVASVPSVNRPALGEALMSLERALLGKILRITGPMLVLLFLLPTCILPANAVPLYTTGFENPPFTLGNLAGQDGWAISATGPSVATTLVENTVVESGGQAVSVGGSVTDQTGPFHSNASTGPLIDLAADIRLKSSTTQNAWQFAGLGPSLTQFLGGIDILANGNVEVITAGFPVVGTLTRDAWHHVDLLFDMTTQTYVASLDGTVLASNLHFCGSNTGCTGAFVSIFGTSLFDTFGNPSGAGNDTGYLDNFCVANVGVVPEPTTLLLWGTSMMGLGLAGWRRRRRD